ncbi:MAG: DUF763 domain-containing protein [Candidatus Aenigmatarchaeota archaeon]
MEKVGIAELPLHYGKAPYWLIIRMRKLAEKIITLIIQEYCYDELLNRLANPFWFQALSCVLGYDWHSSGTTTVTTAVIKAIAKPELGFALAGGKGKFSLKTPEEIRKFSEIFNLSTQKTEELIYASRMAAKVDNSLIQADYPLYHHAFFFTEKGRWVVIQQGMCIEDQTARRYHWISDKVKSFVEEPHSAICCDLKKENVLDMTSKKSEEARKISVDLIKEGPRRIKNDFLSIKPIYQKSLKEFLNSKIQKEFKSLVLKMPRNINWDAVKNAYDFQPKNYEELIGIKGIGPSTIRGLALVSEIIYGAPPSWKDPVKFSFAYGGKDAVPRPVDRKAMDESIKFLDEVIKEAKLNKKEKLEVLKRLKSLAQ